MNVFRPGDPSPEDFDPAESRRVAGKMTDIARHALEGDEVVLTPALALGALSEVLGGLPTEALREAGALVNAELALRGDR